MKIHIRWNNMTQISCNISYYLKLKLNLYYVLELLIA